MGKDNEIIMRKSFGNIRSKNVTIGAWEMGWMAEIQRKANRGAKIGEGYEGIIK